MDRIGRLEVHWPGDHKDEAVASFGRFPIRKVKGSSCHVIACNDEQVASSVGLRKNKLPGGRCICS
jgi:predicted ATP-grasp superfamily ATP-dependent carboligase